eukprot:770682-Pelagomonas_calceolata.AAC.1
MASNSHPYLPGLCLFISVTTVYCSCTVPAGKHVCHLGIVMFTYPTIPANPFHPSPYVGRMVYHSSLLNITALPAAPRGPP